jgi:hypothetical protein
MTFAADPLYYPARGPLAWLRLRMSSRPLAKPAHVRLVFFDPASHLIRRQGARLGQRGALSPESQGQKKNQFLLLGGRESGSSGFDLGERDHAHTRTLCRTRLPRESAGGQFPQKISFDRERLQSLGATSCDLLRSSACVGFCVALARDLTFSRGKCWLFSILLGELRHSLAR